MFGAWWNHHNNVLSFLSISLDSQKHHLREATYALVWKQKKMSVGLINAFFLSVLDVLQIVTARNLY